MAAPTNNAPGFAQKFFFNIPPDVPRSLHPIIKQFGQALNDHDQAIRTVNANMTSTSPTKGSGGSSTTTTTNAPSVTPQQVTKIANTSAQNQIASTFGKVNNQSADYAVQSADYGGIVTFSSASPLAATLNPAVNAQFYTGVQNLGPGTVTLTPGAGVSAAGTINGQATIDLENGFGAFVYYDGANWWAVTTPPSQGFPNPMTAEGDLIVGGAAGAPGRLPIGAAGDVLTSNGTDASWQPAGGGGSGVTDVNGLTGSVTLAAGSNVTITPSGNTLTIASSGGGGGATYLKGSGAIVVNANPDNQFYSGSATVAGAAVGMPVSVMPAVTGFAAVLPILSGIVTAANTVGLSVYFPQGFQAAGGGAVANVNVFVVVFP